MEEWRDIVGYEGLYQVSNKGRIKSLKRTAPCRGGVRTVNERIMKMQRNHDGYINVSLRIGDGSYKTLKVHRIVAQAFIDNPLNLPDVNHIDDNPSNNCVENLEWCSKKYNIDWAHRDGRIILKPILQPRKVIKILCDKKCTLSHENVSMLAKALGVDITEILEDE